MTDANSRRGAGQAQDREEQTAGQMRRVGVVLLAAGVVFQLVSGTLLDRYADYVSSTADVEYAVASHVFAVVDAILIPLGVGMLVGGLVVSALRETTR